MEGETHGHEIMKMMIEIGRPLKRDEILAAIINRFGEDARFHTCSANGLDSHEILELLESKGKFVERDGLLSTNKEKICNHGEEHSTISVSS